MSNKLSLGMGGGGVTQPYSSLDDIRIDDNVDVVLFTPDAGKAKDEYFGSSEESVASL